MSKPRVATVWLDGCSGCHMSFLDMDERLLPVLSSIDLVYSPLVDSKQFPDSVDITLVEGAISNEEDLHKIKFIREHTKYLIALGDCAVTSNVPSMRNPFKKADLFDQAYIKNATAQAQIPTDNVPPLLLRARPIHEIVPVDLFIPGCPPDPETIFYVLGELLEGRKPDLAGKSQFG